MANILNYNHKFHSDIEILKDNLVVVVRIAGFFVVVRPFNKRT